MRLAIPIWAGRVSPVFDVAGQLLTVDLRDGIEAARQVHSTHAVSLHRRAEILSELGVEVLVCGAVSQSLEAALLAKGIRVMARISGDAEEVLGAFLANRLGEPAYRMPGCHSSTDDGCVQGGRGRRRRRAGRSCPAPLRDESGGQQGTSHESCSDSRGSDA